MNIALLHSNLQMLDKYNQTTFAPKKLYLDLAEGLVEKGHTVYLFTTSNIKTKGTVIPGDQYIEKIENEASHYNLDKETSNEFENRISEYDLSLYRQCLDYAQKNKIDIIHDYGPKYGFYFANVSKVPVVFNMHGYTKNVLEINRLKKFNYLNYVTISQNHSRIYTQEYRINPIATIYHGINLSEYKFQENYDNYGLFGGRIVPEKGLTEAIAVTQKLNTRLKIVSGEDSFYSQYFKETIEPLIKKSSVELLAYHQTTKEKSMGQAKFFLFPISWEEPFGMVLIESMAYGTPVIAFAQGSVPEIMKDGQTGFVVNISNKDIRGNWIIKKNGMDGLCEAVNRLNSLSNEDYLSMRKACRAHVEKNFTIGKMVNNYERLYEQIVNMNKIT